MTLIVMLMGRYSILLQEETDINSSLLMRKLATLQLLEIWIEKWYVFLKESLKISDDGVTKSV